ncbi:MULTISPECIES: hypothetical protein [unclassified Mesorhizobium]|uniref:hypothetical protein n=1 Tax=unclassified Mesorhizobium TaxID=325217 RepID=UPI001FDFDF86|nr:MULTISPECIES: hypothetical protein [unclassified Mesorhizobium]
MFAASAKTTSATAAKGITMPNGKQGAGNDFQRRAGGEHDGRSRKSPGGQMLGHGPELHEMFDPGPYEHAADQ